MSEANDAMLRVITRNGERMYIIFDMDGVIFDTERLALKAWEAATSLYDIQNIEETARLCIGTNAVMTKQLICEYIDQAYPALDYDYDRMKAAETKWMQDYFAENGMPLMPFVKDILEWLRDNHIPTAVASSTNRELVLKELGMAGLTEYFQIVVGGNDLKRSKPFPDIFLRTAELLEGDPKDTWVIEDSYNGIRAAYSAGMHPVMVPDLKMPDEEMISKAEVILKDLSAVKEYLKELRRQK